MFDELMVEAESPQLKFLSRRKIRIREGNSLDSDPSVAWYVLQDINHNDYDKTKCYCPFIAMHVISI